jgi:hypothetical protein
VGKTRREGERKRTLAAGADEPERHRASRRLYPSSAVSGGTRWHRVVQGGMKNPSRIKGMAGKGASCLRFSIPPYRVRIPPWALRKSLQVLETWGLFSLAAPDVARL